MATFQPDPEYDIIFAGGGTSACVTAGRLAAADPSLSILIVERGGNTINDVGVATPANFFANMAPGREYSIPYYAEKEPALNNRNSLVSTGGTLGGGSSINAMMYSRAQRIDFDSFNTDGWDYESLLPFAKKLETLHPDDKTFEGTKSLHGYSGPINISRGTRAPKGHEEDFFAAAQSYGVPELKDMQDFETINGFSVSRKYVGPDGKRQSTARQYIKPLLEDGRHPNLHILPESKVKRVIFDGKRAVGIEYEPDPQFLQQGTSLTKSIIRSVRARKLVVVSAGALGTPSILERSGVGNKELLTSLDIPIISELPGVGENYQDHHFLLQTYKTTLSEDDTLDALITGRKDFEQLVAANDPYLGTNGIDISGKLRMTDEEVAALGPEFKAVWDADFAKEPSKPVMLMCVVLLYLGDHRVLEPEEAAVPIVTIPTYTPYPYSRGSVHIRTTDTNDPPKFYTGFLADKDDIDLKKAVWAYKKGRDIYRRTNAFAGELAVGHPKYREGSKAALSKGPLREGGFSTEQDRKEIPPLEYDADDDRAIEQFARDNISTTWHSLGTCKMAPREKGGVVDEDLNVYGTEGLKCVDLSIIPENVGANTNNTALIVGEKAADIIAKELGLDIDTPGALTP